MSISFKKLLLISIAIFLGVMSSSAHTQSVTYSSSQENNGTSVIFQSSTYTPTIDVTVNPGVTLSNIGGSSAGNSVIYIDSSVNSLTNYGTIQSDYYTFTLNSSSDLLASLINYGSITQLSGGCCGDNPAISTNGGTITTITNLGSISSSGGYSIDNYNYGTPGLIGTFNNAQGGNNSSASTTVLAYNGALPTNYSIIINSTANYGQLSVSNPSGTTTFGIYPGSTVSNGTYTSVISGLVSSGSYIAATIGTYGSGSWTLSEVDSILGIWDLIFAGYYPSTADTQQSLVNTASALQPIYTLQNSVLANSFSYDCSLFGANGVCISAGGRNTAVQAANGLNNTSALLIGSYRLDKNNSRIGAYADQNLSVNNAGSTVNLGNNTPLVGLFGVWSERPDAIGAEVKVSAAFGQKDTTITRQVVGDSEAGSGSSTLNSQGAQVVAKYGFGVAKDTVVSPYVGMRYTQNNMGGYTENTSATVTAPLTYSALNTNATTALAGVGARHLLTPKTMVMASVGVESDTNTANGSYSGTSSSISGLTPVNFNANPVRTRPTASVGAYYNVEKNQRIGLSGIYRQEPYQAVSTTSVFLTYTIGL
jgi:hypothetical protein